MIKKLFGLTRLDTAWWGGKEYHEFQQRIASMESERQHLLSALAMRDDALDHIQRVAGMASTVTKRLDWIMQRAEAAKMGEVWDNAAAVQINTQNWKAKALYYRRECERLDAIVRGMN